MKSFFIFSATAASLVAAAPSIKPAGWSGPRIYNKFADDYKHISKRNCDSIPDGQDPDVLVRIYKVAKSRGVSDRVMLSMFETCQVETHCNNLDCGDQDSVGVFQQRTSQGWGSIDDIMNVEYSAGKYLDLAISTDQQQGPDVSAGVLAQMVQRSDFPDRYEEVKDLGQQLWDKAKELAGDSGSQAPSSTSQAPEPTQTPEDPEDGDDDCDPDSGEPTATSSTAPSEPTETPTDPDGCDDDGDDEPSATSSSPVPTPTGDDDDDCDDDGDDTPPSQPTSPPTTGDGDDDDCDDDDPVPSSSTTSAPQPTSGACAQSYTVQSGDVCNAIASKFGISLSQFYSWNSQIDSDCQNLEIGQAYCVKH